MCHTTVVFGNGPRSDSEFETQLNVCKRTNAPEIVPWDPMDGICTVEEIERRPNLQAWTNSGLGGNSGYQGRTAGRLHSVHRTKAVGLCLIPTQTAFLSPVTFLLPSLTLHPLSLRPHCIAIPCDQALGTQSAVKLWSANSNKVIYSTTLQ